MWKKLWMMGISAMFAVSCKSQEGKQVPTAGTKSNTKLTTKPVMAQGESRLLFDGKTLANWQTAEFGAHGEPMVKDGSIVLPVGDPMTGVTWTGAPMPKMNYEVTCAC